MRNKNITKKWVASLLLGATGLLTSNLHASWPSFYSDYSPAYVDQNTEELLLMSQLNSLTEGPSRGQAMTEFIIEAVAKNGSGINLSYHDPNPDSGTTLLHIAAEAGAVKAVKYLLEQGVSAHIRDFGEFTPLQRAEDTLEDQKKMASKSRKIPSQHKTRMKNLEQVIEILKAAEAEEDLAFSQNLSQTLGEDLAFSQSLPQTPDEDLAASQSLPQTPDEEYDLNSSRVGKSSVHNPLSSSTSLNESAIFNNDAGQDDNEEIDDAFYNAGYFGSLNDDAGQDDDEEIDLYSTYYGGRFR
jgi:hypothetical protein